MDGAESAYLELDAAIADWNKKVRHHHEQDDYAGRSEAYCEKARHAASRGDRTVAQDMYRLAAADLTTALSSGERFQVAKVGWFIRRGETQRACAELMERGTARRLLIESSERDYGDALRRCAGGVDGGIPAVDIMTLRAEARLALNRLDDAAEDFSLVLNRTDARPARVRALTGRAEAMALLRDHARAQEDYTGALQLTMGAEPVDAAALAHILFARSRSNDALGRTDECLADLSKALELVPDHAAALETRATLTYELGMYQESDSDLRDALQLGGAASPALAELFRKLQRVVAVTVHLRGARGLTAGGRQVEAYCRYAARPCSGLTTRALVEGRTLSCVGAAEPEWDEVVQFDVPNAGYRIDLSVHDESPAGDAPFLGRCEIPLPARPSSKGAALLALGPKTARRVDVAVFAALTDGGKGLLDVAWHSAPKFAQYPPPASTKAGVQVDTSGVLCDSDSLRELFRKFDVDNNGWLSREEVRAVYEAFDTFGVPSDDIDAILARMGAQDDGRVTFDEFAILMLKISQR